MNNLLEIRDLEVGIEDKTILNGVDLEIKPGEIHVLMGQNGVGKSTLVSALMGDPKYDVSSGQIILDGEDITDTSAKGNVHVLSEPGGDTGCYGRGFLKSRMRFRKRREAESNGVQEGTVFCNGCDADGSFLCRQIS